MREIMISVQPQWVEKILNGEKTIEIRKTMPKCELPCKVYIYCTKNSKQILAGTSIVKHSWVCWNRREWSSQQKKDCGYGRYNGKVVAEFTLTKIDKIEICDPDVLVNGEMVDVMGYKADTGLTLDKFTDYIGYGDDHDGWGSKEWSKGYGWHIDDLKIYDNPKELSEFSHYIPDNQCPKKECGIDCEDCMSYDSEHETCLALYYLYRQIKRPPQSWFYVEKVEE